jgi:hypothetical protein
MSVFFTMTNDWATLLSSTGQHRSDAIGTLHTIDEQTKIM